MRILILSRSYPFPPDTGASRRIAAFVSGLAERGHSVTLLALQAQVNDPESSQPASKPWRESVYNCKNPSYVVAIRSTLQGYTYHEAKFWCSDFKEAVDRILSKESFDVVIVNFLTTSRYLDGWLDEQGNGRENRPLIVLDQHNLDEVVWQRHVDYSSNIIRKIYTRNQLAMIKRLQRKWLPRYDIVCSVSQSDLEGTEPYLSENTRMLLAPNGVDTEYFQPFQPQKKDSSPPVLVFVAAMDVTMNQDAANWFVENVFPLVRQSQPEAQFWIVSRDPNPAIQRLSKIEGVRVTGTVSDVRDYYREADICVVPLRMGGGTKLKTVEAMAMGMPVVSTSVGVQGLDVENGIQFHLADEAQDFAQKINDLLHEPAAAENMGKEARVLVCAKYGWRRIVGKVENSLQDLLHSANNGNENEAVLDHGRS